MTSIIARVTTVDSIKGPDVVLSEEMYKNLKAKFGTLTLSNLETKQVVHIPKCVNSSCYSSHEELYHLGKQGGGASIVVPKGLAEKLSLQPGTHVKLTNAITPQESRLWDAGEDETNNLGSSWLFHSYVAKACFAGYQPEFNPSAQYPGIYLDDMQQENLNLKATLQPLCGRNKFTAIKERSPNMVGMVKIFYKDQVMESAVYPAPFHHIYPRSAITMNAALFSQFPDLKIGDSLRICSRFDVEDSTVAESLKSDPEIEKAPSYQARDWLQMFLIKPSEKDIFPEGFKNNLTDKLVLAQIMEDLTRNAKALASKPRSFLNVISFMGSLKDIAKKQEYSRLLAAVSNEIAHLKDSQEQLLAFLEEKLLNKSRDANPHLLDVLFKMGADMLNAAGENCLHIMYRTGKGTCCGSSSETGYKDYPVFEKWMKQKTPEGKTPLHYLCQKGDWKEVLLIGGKWKTFSSEDFVSSSGTPFHDLAANLSKKTGEKYLTLSQIVENLGIECLSWFDKKDSNDCTPWQQMIYGDLEAFSWFLSMLKHSKKDDKNDDKNNELNKHIYNYIASRLDLKPLE